MSCSGVCVGDNRKLHTRFPRPLLQVTGGQGYIGCHTVLRLLEEGFLVTVVRCSPFFSQLLQGRALPALPPRLSAFYLRLVSAAFATAIATTLSATRSSSVDYCIPRR